jgi:protocatechuate 3,4-dioxygenase beta subunit
MLGTPHDPVGLRRIGRRDVLLTLGAGLGSLAAGAPLLRGLGRALAPGEALAQATCAQTPELTEGPYYLSGAPTRHNVTERGDGVVLFLSLTVVDSATCAIVPGAEVEIWHADANGVYSGFNGASDDTFMRGGQTVGDAGVATFRTIYPGWYTGRTPHIHVKVHVGGNTVHTGQLFFDETVTAAVYAREPYVGRGTPDTSNASDGIFQGGGAQTLMTPAKRGDAYWAAITLAVAT